LLYWFMKRVAGRLGQAVYRPTVEGLENIPTTGPVMLASNHLAFVDSIVIPMVVPRRVNFLAKAEYFEGKGVKGALMRGFFGGLGHIPVQRGSGRAARAALDTAEEVLNNNGAFAIYPEGTRSLDGRLYRGHAGVARIALATGAPVVPVGLKLPLNMLTAGAYRLEINPSLTFSSDSRLRWISSVEYPCLAL